MQTTVSLLAMLTLAAPAPAQDGALEARLTRLERKLDNKALLELMNQVEQLQQEVRRLRGEIENQGYALEQLRKSQRDLSVNLDGRLGVLEQGGTISVPPAETGTDAGATWAVEPPLPTLPETGGGAIAGEPSEQSMAIDVEEQEFYRVPAAPPPRAQAASPPPAGAPGESANAPDPAPGVGDGAPATAAPGDASAGGHAAVGAPGVADEPPPGGGDSAASEAAYREAFTMLKAGQYEESIAAFDSYLEDYPGSQYADNAQYWLGEAHYVMRRYEPAIEHYRALVENYPDSQKQSHALLKIAYSHSELGRHEQALEVLNDLKARYPGSAAARLADERMQRIRAQLP